MECRNSPPLASTAPATTSMSARATDSQRPGKAGSAGEWATAPRPCMPPRAWRTSSGTPLSVLPGPQKVINRSASALLAHHAEQLKPLQRDRAGGNLGGTGRPFPPDRPAAPVVVLVIELDA